jgi:hypothetical protein
MPASRHLFPEGKQAEVRSPHNDVKQRCSKKTVVSPEVRPMNVALLALAAAAAVLGFNVWG